ncbi:hypothetical protein NST58_14705 [Paenibacillus sp. FSL R10-2796]|uniref:hypothetical protein n=1 Tax=Paenibacillus sp. FSL R10-2796 TaxID=2954663 RepID=UPI0030DC0349
MEAIQHAFEAEDYTFSASCMDRPFNSIIKDGDESTLLDLLDKLSIKNMIVHFDLFYFQAGSMAVAGRSDDAKRFLQRLNFSWKRNLLFRKKSKP